MGVKSTTRLSRNEAETRYVSEALKEQVAKLTAIYEARASTMTDVQLEDELERINDEYFQREYGSGGFDNFLISDE